MKSLPPQFSYNQIISMKPHNPINFDITLKPIWPRAIHLLTEKDVVALDVSRLEQHSLDPKSSWGAALKALLEGGRCNEAVDVHAAMNFWWLNHEKVVNYMIYEETWSTEKEYIAYNSTWCRLGYTTNQTSEVKEIVRNMYFDGAFKHRQYLEKMSCYR